MYIMTISFISGEKNREKKLCPQDTIKPLWSHKVVISTACNCKLKKRICVSTKYKMFWEINYLEKLPVTGYDEKKELTMLAMPINK
jgi:hypothetical protein